VFAKIAFLILSVGAVACVLLSIRQSRIQTAHEMARCIERINEHDRTLWRLRSEIASMITPDRVEQRVVALGPLRPISPERMTTLARLEAEAVRETAITAQPLDDEPASPDR
jgi:hypothetical protein